MGVQENPELDKHTEDRSPIELSGIELSGIELSRIELSGIELSGLLTRLIELSGIELSGIELSGIELSGIELRGTPARASDSNVTPLSEPSAASMPKSDEQSYPSEVNCEHHAVNAPDAPLSAPGSAMELSGAAPSSIELSGIELSGLDARSRAPSSTVSKLAADVGLVSTSASVTDSRGTPSYGVSARMPSQPVQGVCEDADEEPTVQPAGYVIPMSDNRVLSSASWSAAIGLFVPGTAIELSGIELSGIELSGEAARSMELSGMELSGIELSGAEEVPPELPDEPSTVDDGTAEAGTVSTPATVGKPVVRDVVTLPALA